jgi:hypothetical protein
VDWIGLAQDRYRWRALVSSLGNEPSGSIKCWELLNGCTTCGLSCGTRLHRFSYSYEHNLEICQWYFSQGSCNRIVIRGGYKLSVLNLRLYVEALSYKQESHGFEPQWGNWISSIYLILPAAHYAWYCGWISFWQKWVPVIFMVSKADNLTIRGPNA